MPFVPLRRGAGRLFDENLNTMISELYSQDTAIAAGGFVFGTATAAEIADVADALNTTGKAVGRPVWDATNNRLMVASGAAAASPWYVADGSASVTPA